MTTYYSNSNYYNPQDNKNGIFGTSSFSFSALSDFSDLSSSVRSHLSAVYRLLAICVLIAAGGAYTHFTYAVGGTITFLATIGCIFGIAASANENTKKGFLFALSFFQGASLGPLISAVVHLEDGEKIVFTAFTTSVGIFVSLSLCALYAQKRSFLFLGGLLSSGLSMLCILSLLSLLGLASNWVLNIQLYGGLLLFSGFVLFDTQLIIEKVHMGRKDVVKDALELFLDFINIFVRILVILTKNQGKKEKKENR